MKILQINKLYYPTIGGIETIVKDIAQSLNGNDNLFIDVLACQAKGGRQIELIDGIKVYKAASFGKSLGMPLSLDFFKLFLEIKNDYDLFIIHYPFPLASLIALFIPKEKLIIYYHSDIVRQTFFRIPFLPFINLSLKKAKKILTSGKNIIYSSSLLKRHKEKCEVVPFGIDTVFTEEDRKEAVKIKDLYFNNILLLCIGRLVYYKGFQYAIESMANVDASLLIIGQGPEECKMKRLITKLGLQNKVFIIPPQNKLSPYLLASDIFLFPSTERSEAFGLVQIEAMAAGLPVINTYLHTAVEEVSINEVSGLTVEPKNTKLLNEAINKLVKNKLLRTKYGEDAKKRYLKLFKKDIFVKNLMTALLDRRP
jgi:rhamnosyl/mannosyltransferase